MISAAQAVLVLATVCLWLAARPTWDGRRIRARTASQLTEPQWARLWLEHGRAVVARDRDRRQRREWLRGLSRHLASCEVRWTHDGWQRPTARVLAFHRKYAETQR